MLQNEQARVYFNEKGLSYKDITAEKLDLLETLLVSELAAYRNSGDKHAAEMALQLRKPLKKDRKILKRTGLHYANFRVSGSYFQNREAISFNRDGFIGFGGEFSTANVQPMLKAFIKWCKEIAPENTEIRTEVRT